MLVAASLLAGGLPFVVGAQETSDPCGAAAEGGGQCIPAAARAAVEECPAGAPPPSKRAGFTGASAPQTHFEQTKRREEEKKAGPVGPSVEVDVASEALRRSRDTRARSLLEQEVTVLQRIVGRLRADDPRGAETYLRLAETYFELQTYWNSEARRRDELIFQAQQAGQADRVSQLQREQREAEEQVTHFRQEAIRTYAQLIQSYPNYQDMDRVLFSLAYGLEEMRQFDRARQVYFRLIKSHPESQYVPYAYLSFAEYYFGTEGDMRAATQFYQKVLEFPPERNPVYGYALYKMAWAMYNLEDFRGALAQFVRTIEFAQANPDARDVENLARQSRRELVLPYSRVGRPQQALEFFRRYATDEAQALEMLENLGELYYDTGQWPETIQTYHRLMAEQASGDRLCYWQSRVTHAVISSRPKPEQVTEVRRLVDVMNAFNQASHPAEAMAECRSLTASVLVELSTAWHREAIGTDDQPGTNDRSTMQAATQLYRLTLDTFPDMDGMEFPEIDRRDWPTVYRVSYFYAELLWRMEDWAQCGPAFDRVVELNPSGEFTADAAYAAVLCYNNLYQQQYQGSERERRGGAADEDDGDSGGRGRGRRGRRGRRAAAEEEEESATATLAPTDLTPVQQGMLGAFRRYRCFVDSAEELPQIKYREARIYYETNHFAEAAILFRDVAWNHRDHELAEFAANLYLDSLNMLGTRVASPSPDCLTALEGSLEPLHGFYCDTQEHFDSHPDLCGVVQQLRCDVRRARAEALQRTRQWRQAAACYVDLFRRFRQCGRMDEVLYNAAINYEAARLLGRAIRVRTVLIERFPESALSKRALYLVGANYHALAIYSRAADYYEQFATRYPGEDGSECTQEDRDANTCAIAYQALENAVFFRLGLGEEERAIEDARLYERNYRRTRARETAQVIFSLGSIYERRGEWTRVFDHYRQFLRNYGRTAPDHMVIRAHVQMGRALWETDDRDHADDHFTQAVRAWQGGAAESIARASDVSDDERGLWIRRAMDATSEALFYLAEYRYQEFRAIHFPRLPSTRTMASVTRWSQEDLVPWLTRKREALVTAEQAYNLIGELRAGEEIAPPQWQIAAAARIGQMYQTIVDQMREAPIPEEIERDDELYGIYVDALEGALNGSNPGPDGRPLTEDDVACTPDSTEASCVSSPVRQAISKFEFCLTLATRVRWFSEFSHQCEVELNRLDAARYPLAAELRGTASFVQDQIAAPEPVELTFDEDVESDTTESSVPAASTDT